MTDFKNIQVKYSDIITLKYFKYRLPNPPHSLRREIVITTNLEDTIRIRKTQAQRQMMEKLELPFRETQAIYNWEERDKVLRAALQKRQERELKSEIYPLVFRCSIIGNNEYLAWSVVTTEYQEIPVYEAKSAFETSIWSQHHVPQLLEDWQDSGIHFYRYKILDAGGKPVSSKFSGEQANFCILLRVGFSGDRAISLVPSWSLQTLTSEHYITSKKSTTLFRAVHRYLPKDEILKLMQKTVEKVLQKNVLEEPVIATVPSYEQLYDIYLSYRNKYPDHVKDQLDDSWQKFYNSENGFVRIALTLSDVGRNYENLSQAQRLSLEQDAYRCLS